VRNLHQNAGAVAGARLQGAERIICVDLSDERLELARGQGATETWTDPTTAATLSRFLLWEKPTLESALRAFKKRFPGL
jgi:threonine dehydrogenase-like Zn-dependent dehydrogenase